MTKKTQFAFVLLLSFGAFAASCGDSNDSSSSAVSVEPASNTVTEEASDEEASDEEASDNKMGSLSDCPNPIVFQTDWFPEAEHGALYNLTAGDGSIDPESGRFTGVLAADPA